MGRLFLLLAIVGVIFCSVLEWWTGVGPSLHPRLAGAQSTSSSEAAVNTVEAVPQTLEAFAPAVEHERAGKSVTIKILFAFLGAVLVFAFVLFGTTFIGRGMAVK